MTISRMDAAEVDEVDELLTATGREDPVAFVQLYRVMIPRVRARVRRVVIDPVLTDDVAQDVFFEIWRTARRFDPALSPAVAWILRLAHARAVDQVRRTETSRRHEGSSADRSSEVDHDLFTRTDDRIDAAQQVRAGLPQLSELQRQALQLVYLDGHTNTAAADSLGISSSAFKSRLRDGVIAMRQLLTAI